MRIDHPSKLIRHDLAHKVPIFVVQHREEVGERYDGREPGSPALAMRGSAH